MPRNLHVWAVLLVAGCGQSDSTADPVPDRYLFLGGGIAYEDMPDIRAELPYEKIQLEVFSTWTWGGFDATEFIVRVWPVGAEHPIVVSETNAGPIELWAIQTAIDGVASRVEWAAAHGEQVHR